MMRLRNPIALLGAGLVGGFGAFIKNLPTSVSERWNQGSSWKRSRVGARGQSNPPRWRYSSHEPYACPYLQHRFLRKFEARWVFLDTFGNRGRTRNLRQRALDRVGAAIAIVHAHGNRGRTRNLRQRALDRVGAAIAIVHAHLPRRSRR
jgi:hypothetical protein